MVRQFWWVWPRVGIEVSSRDREGEWVLFSQARIEASRWWKHGLRLTGPRDGHEPFLVNGLGALRRLCTRAVKQATGGGRARDGSDIGYGLGRGLGVGPKQFGVWASEVVVGGDDESDCDGLL